MDNSGASIPYCLSYITSSLMASNLDSDILAGLGKQLQLTVDEEQSIQVPTEIWAAHEVDFSPVLVGRCLSRKATHLDSLERTLIGIWNPKKKVSFKKLGDERFLFLFENDLEMRRVMWNSPWSFDRNLVVLRPVPHGETPEIVDLDVSDFLVHVSGIPFSQKNSKMAEFLGNQIGTFVEYDEALNNRVSGSIMCIRIRINIMKPLLRVINIEGPNNRMVQLTLSYDRLPNFCYHCGYWAYWGKGIIGEITSFAQ